MSNLFFHIGPPKTATTSLQFFLQELSNNEIFYGGVIHPRYSSTTLIDKIFSDISLQRRKHQETVHRSLKIYLNSGSIVILSEEMFLHVNSNYSWVDRMRFLYQYLEEFQPRLIITVRNPKEALASYYQQTYNSLPKKLRLNFTNFIESKYGEIYRYQSLQNKLKTIGFCEPIFIDYEQLITGGYTLGEFLNKRLEFQIPIHLSKSNISGKKNKLRFSKRRTLKTSLASTIQKLPKPHLLKGHRLSEKFLKYIPDFSLVEPKSISTEVENNSVLVPFEQEYTFILAHICK